MIEAVVFDLDGVLIDSEPVWEHVRRGLVAGYGGRWPDDAQQRLMGMSTQEWARYLSEDLGIGLPPDAGPWLGSPSTTCRCCPVRWGRSGGWRTAGRSGWPARHRPR